MLKVVEQLILVYVDKQMFFCEKFVPSRMWGLSEIYSNHFPQQSHREILSKLTIYSTISTFQESYVHLCNICFLIEFEVYST